MACQVREWTGQHLNLKVQALRLCNAVDMQQQLVDMQQQRERTPEHGLFNGCAQGSTARV